MRGLVMGQLCIVVAMLNSTYIAYRWSMFLAFGLVLSALLTRTARRWRFLTMPLRGVLEDYGAPLMVVMWTGLSYAVQLDGGVWREC